MEGRATEKADDMVPEPFVRMLLHDFRTPLSSILLHLELLRDGADELSEETREDVANALASAQSLSARMALVDDIGHLRRNDTSFDLVACDLAELATAALSTLPKHEPQHRPALEAEMAPRVTCDPEATKEVIRRLVADARTVTPKEMPVRVRVLEADGRGRIEVIDGGARIPPGLRPKMFELAGILDIRAQHRAFSRGLVPLYCRLAVEGQGGQIGATAEDEGDRSNTVWIDFPTC